MVNVSSVKFLKKQFSGFWCIARLWFKNIMSEYTQGVIEYGLLICILCYIVNILCKVKTRHWCSKNQFNMYSSSFALSMDIFLIQDQTMGNCWLTSVPGSVPWIDLTSINQHLDEGFIWLNFFWQVLCNLFCTQILHEVLKYSKTCPNQTSIFTEGFAQFWRVWFTQVQNSVETSVKEVDLG